MKLHLLEASGNTITLGIQLVWRRTIQSTCHHTIVKWLCMFKQDWSESTCWPTARSRAYVPETWMVQGQEYTLKHEWVQLVVEQWTEIMPYLLRRTHIVLKLPCLSSSGVITIRDPQSDFRCSFHTRTTVVTSPSRTETWWYENQLSRRPIIDSRSNSVVCTHCTH